MRDLQRRIHRLCDAGRLDAECVDSSLEVRLGDHTRTQRVRFGVTDGIAWFESTVLSTARVGDWGDDWHSLARAAWIRNDIGGLVGFGFDDRDRLVGRVEVPLATLDDPEIVASVRELAAECDRFERAVVGGDEE